jgi:hypothetical protein
VYIDRKKLHDIIGIKVILKRGPLCMHHEVMTVLKYGEDHEEGKMKKLSRICVLLVLIEVTSSAERR